MDSSTVLFIVTLIIAFVFMRWLVSPVPQHMADPDDVPTLANRSATASNTSSSSGPSGRSSRPVTDSMIEVVQSIAPQLSAAQIRMDLQRSGSVEATIERFMETGSLPIPPEEQAAAVAATAAAPVANGASGLKISSKGPENLIEKFGLSDKINSATDTAAGSSSNTWGTSKSERNSLLSKRREEMILNARKRLESQLKNEVEMPLK